jgi:hypothetical protein
MNPRRIARIAAAFLPLLTWPAAAWDLNCKYSADRRAELDAAGAERLEIVARAGDLKVEPGPGSVVRVSGRACASSEEFLEQTQIRTQREGSVLRVFVQVPDEMKGIGIFYAALDLTVRVPDSLPVSITDTSGDIDVEKVRVTAITDSSGDMLLRGTQGDVELNDSSGDLRVENAEGAVAITDSSGDIRIDGAGSVRIRTDSSGDITIRTIAGDVLIERDSSGDISVSGVGGHMELVADSSGTVSVTDVKGSVTLPPNKRD